MNNDIEKIFKYIDDDMKENMNLFINDAVTRTYFPVSDTSCINTNYLNIMDRDVLKNYSGYNFRNINNYLRGTWNYEINGNISNVDIYKNDSRDIIEIIKNNQISLGNIKSYRGTNLDCFKSYGVQSLEDLNKLKNGYFLDRAFVSTSLSRDNSFFGVDDNNIEIIFQIPEEFTDMVYLGNVGYSPKQKELLLNCFNIGFINEVEVKQDSAVITITLIPKKVYDRYYSRGNTK